MMGLFTEEIVLGQRWALGEVTFTADNMIAYSRKFDPVGFHVDEAVGRASLYGAMTAAGLHVGACWMACFVKRNTEARALLEKHGKVLPEIGPSPGFRNMRWLKPVCAGDVISFFATPTHKRALASRPGWGMLSGFNEGVNRNGDLVFSFESAVLTASLSVGADLR
jgi:acyl dehydratase